MATPSWKRSRCTGIGTRRIRVPARLPCPLGLGAGYAFDLAKWVTKRSFPTSSIGVRKFCSTTQFATAIAETGFVAPMSLEEGLRRTVKHEFLEDHRGERVFVSE